MYHLDLTKAFLLPFQSSLGSISPNPFQAELFFLPEPYSPAMPFDEMYCKADLKAGIPWLTPGTECRMPLLPLQKAETITSLSPIKHRADQLCRPAMSGDPPLRCSPNLYGVQHSLIVYTVKIVCTFLINIMATKQKGG